MAKTTSEKLDFRMQVKEMVINFSGNLLWDCFPEGELQRAIKEGEITIPDIAEWFRDALYLDTS